MSVPVAVFMTAVIWAGATYAQQDAGWRPVLECQFTVECSEDAAGCVPRDILYIIRHNAETGEFLVFDVANQSSRPVTLRQQAHVLVFDGFEDRDEPKPSSSTERLVVAEDGQASFQFAFHVEFDADDWRFFSGENTGLCTEITQ